MKKLSKITEGVIGDIIKRAASDEERVEDDVNDMNCNEFFQYIFKSYVSVNDNNTMMMADINNRYHETMYIPMCYEDGKYISMHIEFKEDDIQKICITYIPNSCRSIMGKLFYITKGVLNDYIVKSRTGKIDNNTCIKALDTILNNCEHPCFKKINGLTEGAIGDIIKRAVSDEERVEDSIIENMTAEEFKKYIETHYILKSRNYIKTKNMDFYPTIYIPLIRNPLTDKKLEMIVQYPTPESGEVVRIDIRGGIEKYKDVYKKIKSKYSIAWGGMIDANQLDNNTAIEIINDIIHTIAKSWRLIYEKTE